MINNVKSIWPNFTKILHSLRNDDRTTPYECYELLDFVRSKYTFLSDDYSNLFSLSFTILLIKPKERYCYSAFAVWRYLLSPFHFEDFFYRLSILKFSPIAFPFWTFLLSPSILMISPIAFPFWWFLLSPSHFEDFSYRLSILVLFELNILKGISFGQLILFLQGHLIRSTGLDWIWYPLGYCIWWTSFISYKGFHTVNWSSVV